MVIWVEAQWFSSKGFAIRYSLFAIRYSLFAIRYSLFVIRYSQID